MSFRFPPYGSMGALNVGKTAKLLLESGHDVKVVSAARQPLQEGLPVEIPVELVTYAPWINLTRPAAIALGGESTVSSEGYVPRGSARQVLGALGNIYRQLLIPDPQIGWLPGALMAGRRLLRAWHPDVVYASAPPFTSLLVGAGLARAADSPFVANLRDLWTNNPYRELGPRRLRVERAIESRVLRRAAHIVTTNEHAARLVRSHHDIPVVGIMGGYDDDELADQRARPPSAEPLSIVHTGTLNAARDPSPLFIAVSRLMRASEKGTPVEIDFLGRYTSRAGEKADELGAHAAVRLGEQVHRARALEAQRNADVLLLLGWDDPRDRIRLPGKLFEYLAARRPILAIAPTGGVVDDVVSGSGAGLVCSDPGRIEQQLRAWIDEKRSTGIQDLSRQTLDGFSRAERVAELEQILERVVREFTSGNARRRSNRTRRRRCESRRESHSLAQGSADYET